VPLVSQEEASKIAADHVKKYRGTEEVDVASVEKGNNCWIVRGTCPIDLEGHGWAEKFAVSVDERGKVRKARFALL
jgi:hypothetical protein